MTASKIMQPNDDGGMNGQIGLPHRWVHIAASPPSRTRGAPCCRRRYGPLESFSESASIRSLLTAHREHLVWRDNRMAQAIATPPQVEIRPFRINVRQAQLDDLRM